MFVVVTDIKQNVQTNLSRYVPVLWDMIITKPFIHLKKIHTLQIWKTCFGYSVLSISSFMMMDTGYPEHVFQF